MSQLAHRTAHNPDKDERTTPMPLFTRLHEQYGLTIDVAASALNHRLPRYYTSETDGLAQSWAHERVWCNPPYSNIRPWLQKAHRSECFALFLLPATTDVAWFHDLVLPHFQVTFLRGRIKFEGYNQGANFGSMLAVLDNLQKEQSL